MFDFMTGVAKKAINSKTGKDYRRQYFEKYPQNEFECASCKKRLPKEKIEIDHIIPQKYNGSNALTNLQPMCKECNLDKKAKINELSAKYSGAALVREIKRLYG